ncbi:MAG TPA: hypothetical protein VK395_12645 [Gemmataceae bacterium]|nr:hypothetical protein [Gemmataceae bacterium]
MATFAFVISVIGWLVCLVALIWIVVLAFQESVLWGLGCLFLAPISLVFVIMYWDEARRPFFIWLRGFVLLILGDVLSLRLL